MSHSQLVALSGLIAIFAAAGISIVFLLSSRVRQPSQIKAALVLGVLTIVGIGLGALLPIVIDDGGDGLPPLAMPTAAPTATLTATPTATPTAGAPPTATPPPTPPPTPTPTPPPPPTPTPTPPIPTLTSIATPTPISYDFEQSFEDWGEHPHYGVQMPGQGVGPYCEEQPSIHYTGNCSLQFSPTEVTENDAYVTGRTDTQGAVVTAYVFVPLGAKACTSQACSTAKLIVWDAKQASHESQYVELIPDIWQELSWDLRDKPWPAPWSEFGIHFYLIDGYRGPVYVDAVIIVK